jgi:hypothetical protein
VVPAAVHLRAQPQRLLQVRLRLLVEPEALVGGAQCEPDGRFHLRLALQVAALQPPGGGVEHLPDGDQPPGVRARFPRIGRREHFLERLADRLGEFLLPERLGPGLKRRVPLARGAPHGLAGPRHAEQERQQHDSGSRGLHPVPADELA